jgi:hypothetical protein
MNFAGGLRFPLDDQGWLSKVAIGTLISLVPVLNWAATGYMLDVVHNVVRGRETPLPEWDNLGDKFVRGLIGVLIQFLWTLPILIFICPMVLIAIAGSAGSPDGELSAGAGVAMGCVGLLMALASLALAPITFVALSRYAVTNSFNEALPGPVLRQLRGNWGPWLTILLALFAVGIVATILVMCTFGIGALLFIPFVFYLQLVQGHWMAQAYRQSVDNQTLPPSMV